MPPKVVYLSPLYFKGYRKARGKASKPYRVCLVKSESHTFGLNNRGVFGLNNSEPYFFLIFVLYLSK